MSFNLKIFVIVAAILWYENDASANVLSSGRIVNGITAGNTPFHAHLIIRQEQGSIEAFVGSGAIISPTIVISAGQNIFGFNYWEIGVGSSSFVNLQFHTTNNAIIHPNYNPATLDFNLGCIVLVTPLVFTPTIQAIVLPLVTDVGSPYVNELGIATGFGFQTNAGNFATTLQQAHLTVIPNNICLQYFPHLTNTINAHFCAMDLISLLAPSNTCSGDQGGPYFVNLRAQITLVGLTSFTDTDCKSGFPTVFTRIVDHLPWINAILS